MFAINASRWSWASLDMLIYRKVFEANGWRFFTWPWPRSRVDWCAYLTSVTGDQSWAGLLGEITRREFRGSLRFAGGTLLLSLYAPSSKAVYPDIANGGIDWASLPLRS